MKSQLIIVEGPQGSGKSSISRLLREKMLSTNLISLSGISDKTESGSTKSFHYHAAVLDMLFDCGKSGLNFVFDRSYLSEKVYCNLGYKPYTFQHQTDLLADKLNLLNAYYDIYFIILTTNEETYHERLKRDKAEYMKFSSENSIKQQNEYIDELANLTANYPSINGMVLTTTGKTPEQMVEYILKITQREDDKHGENSKEKREIRKL